MTTVADVFSQIGLTQWWGKTVSQTFGENGEMGTDFAMPSGLAVGSITSGKVIYVGDAGYGHDPNHSSLGQVVQVLNNDGSLIHYQHLEKASVRVGQAVQPGTVIGLSGGCPVGAYVNPLGRNGCTNGATDQWSTGTHIEVRWASKYNPNGGVWSQSWVNPLTTFLNMSKQDAGNSSATLTSTGSSPIQQTSSAPSTSQQSGNWLDSVKAFAEKSGLFILGVVIAIMGLYLIFKDQIDDTAHKAAGLAEKGAMLAV